MDMTRLYRAIPYRIRPYRIRPYRPIDPTEPGPVIDRKEATVDSIDAVDSVNPANCLLLKKQHHFFHSI